MGGRSSPLNLNCHFGLLPQTLLSGFRGGDDGARTRDLCRDSELEGRNSLKRCVTDGSFQRSETLLAPHIGPLSDPRPLPFRPLPATSAFLTQAGVYNSRILGIKLRLAGPQSSCRSVIFDTDVFLEDASHLAFERVDLRAEVLFGGEDLRIPNDHGLSLQ